MKLSTTVGALARRILRMLDSGERPPRYYRYFAASEALFEQAIGHLCLRGLVAFKGRTKARRLVKARARR